MRWSKSLPGVATTRSGWCLSEAAWKTHVSTGSRVFGCVQDSRTDPNTRPDRELCSLLRPQALWSMWICVLIYSSCSSTKWEANSQLSALECVVDCIPTVNLNSRFGPRRVDELPLCTLPMFNTRQGGQRRLDMARRCFDDNLFGSVSCQFTLPNAQA